MTKDLTGVDFAKVANLHSSLCACLHNQNWTPICCKKSADCMVQRAHVKASDRGTKRSIRPETRSSRQAVERAKRQRVDGPADTAPEQLASAAASGSRRRSTRKCTQQQTAAADLTAAARQPRTARRQAQAARSNHARTPTHSHDARLTRSRGVLPVSQQQEPLHSNKRAKSNSSAERVIGDTCNPSAKPNRTQPSEEPATRQADHPGKRPVPAKARRVSGSVLDVPVGTNKRPSGAGSDLQQEGNLEVSAQGAVGSKPDTIPPADAVAPSTDAAAGPSGSAVDAQLADPSTSHDIHPASDPAQLSPARQHPETSQEQATQHAQRGDTHAHGHLTEAQEGTDARPNRTHQRTTGTLHSSFQGVKTSTAGITKHIFHPDVPHVWSAFVRVPSRHNKDKLNLLFLGKNYWTAEAAARAADRANIALHGREKACTNFPVDWYGPEEKQRCGQDLKARLRSLAGIANNNPRNVRGVPYIKWVAHITANLQKARAKRSSAATKGKQVASTSATEPAIDPGFARQVWEKLTGASANQAEIKGQQAPSTPWHKRVCGQCATCKRAAWQKGDGGRGGEQASADNKCVALPKLRAAHKQLLRLAKGSGQQRFAPADLDEFLASLPDPTREDTQASPSGFQPDSRLPLASIPSDGLQMVTNPGAGALLGVKPGKGLRSMADLSAVPRERRGGAREKGVRKGVRAAMEAKQKGLMQDGHSQLMLDGSPSSGPQTERQLPPGPGRGRPRGSGNKRQRLHAEHAVTWTDAAVSALQVREDTLFSVQEQARVLAADAAPHQGSYQPLLASAPPAVDSKARFRWPDHHAADLRHINRCAKEGKLVEVRNHDWWGAPALGMLGVPQETLQGSLGSQPAQQHSGTRFCQWCKAEDHLVKDCPLNGYFDERDASAGQGNVLQEPQQRQAKQKGTVAEANASQKAAPAEWLGQVSEPVRGVMSALQQMASVAVQANEQRDSSHARLVQSMTPDALLACGLLVDELMNAQLETHAHSSINAVPKLLGRADQNKLRFE